MPDDKHGSRRPSPSQKANWYARERQVRSKEAVPRPLPASRPHSRRLYRRHPRRRSVESRIGCRPLPVRSMKNSRAWRSCAAVRLGGWLTGTLPAEYSESMCVPIRLLASPLKERCVARRVRKQVWRDTCRLRTGNGTSCASDYSRRGRSRSLSCARGWALSTSTWVSSSAASIVLSWGACRDAWRVVVAGTREPSSHTTR